MIAAMWVIMALMCLCSCVCNGWLYGKKPAESTGHIPVPQQDPQQQQFLAQPQQQQQQYYQQQPQQYVQQQPQQYAQFTGSAKEWFAKIFEDDHYKHTKAQFDALDEGTKAQVRAVFDDFDVFKK